jgi:hypothetical protein
LIHRLSQLLLHDFEGQRVIKGRHVILQGERVCACTSALAQVRAYRYYVRSDKAAFKNQNDNVCV